MNTYLRIFLYSMKCLVLIIITAHYRPLLLGSVNGQGSTPSNWKHRFDLSTLVFPQRPVTQWKQVSDPLLGHDPPVENHQPKEKLEPINNNYKCSWFNVKKTPYNYKNINIEKLSIYNGMWIKWKHIINLKCLQKSITDRTLQQSTDNVIFHNLMFFSLKQKCVLIVVSMFSCSYCFTWTHAGVNVEPELTGVQQPRHRHWRPLRWPRPLTAVVMTHCASDGHWPPTMHCTEEEGISAWQTSCVLLLSVIVWSSVTRLVDAVF